jgi:hypothetical protein
LEKWVSTTCRKVWRRVRHLLPTIIDRRDGGGISGRAGPPPSPGHHRKHSEDPPFSHTIPALPAPGSLPTVVCDHSRNVSPDAPCLLCYLQGRQNCAKDIEKLNDILQMPQVLLEIGCGSADAASQIAMKNPGIGVIATDLYAGSGQPSGGSGYGKIAHAWRDQCLPAQVDTPANLVVLRAEACLLRCLPARAIDTVFLLNPEPSVGKSFLTLIQEDAVLSKIKQGLMQIVILPFSRELGLAACGGFSFDHDPDWSRGLGFIMGSGLRFRRETSIHWGLDLSLISAYTKNSTQRGVYAWGEPPGRAISVPTGQDNSHSRQ